MHRGAAVLAALVQGQTGGQHQFYGFQVVGSGGVRDVATPGGRKL
jgi:hypothetical protein